MDIAILTAGIVAGVVSIMFGLIRTRDVDNNLFVKPVLRPLRNIDRQINENLPPEGEKCPDCPNDFVEPYLRITMRRVDIFSNLGTIFAGLLAQALLFWAIQRTTASVSYFVWAMLPGVLCGHYLLELKDVFYYWSRPVFRYALSIVVIVIGIIGSVDSFYLDIVGWILNPWVYLSIGEFRILVGQILVLLAGAFILFIVLRYYLNKRIPSLRNRLVRYLNENPEGLTLTGWYNHLDPNRLIWSEEEILRCIRELVYQGIMTIRLENRSSEPMYGRSQ